MSDEGGGDEDEPADGADGADRDLSFAAADGADRDLSFAAADLHAVASEHRPRAGYRGFSAPVRCSGCGSQLDALRAAHVAIFDVQLHYFCDYEDCRPKFLQRKLHRGPDPHRVHEGPDHRVEVGPASVRGGGSPQVFYETPHAASTGVSDEPQPSAVAGARAELIEPVVDRVVGMPADAEDGSARGELAMLLVASSLIAGALAMALEFAPPTRLVAAARALLVIVGVASLIGRAFGSGRDPARPRPWSLAAPPISAGMLALAGLAAPELRSGSAAIFVAATVLTVLALDSWLVGALAIASDTRRRLFEALLDEGTRAPGAGASRTGISGAIHEVGDLITIESDATVPVDLEVVDADAELVRWPDAVTSTRCRAGDLVVAGARVVAGPLRGRVTATGDDRAFARAVFVEACRPDVHSDVPSLARGLVERGAPALAALAGAIHAVAGHDALTVAAISCAVYASLANVGVGVLASLVVARGVREAVLHGIAYQSAAAWERCAKATTAVFCARGTLMRGEPEVAEFVSLARGAEPSVVAGRDADELLILAASVLSTAQTPNAHAIQRAARLRRLPLEAVRSVRGHADGGTTAQLTSGEEVCVGSRAFLIERSISVAAAERMLTELESSGRTVLLAARGGRLVGLCALQDGLRSGARAAVQHLLDANIEPVLLSADSRETCEALGRALDIDHLRADVHGEQVPEAVERIAASGAITCVIGHVPQDHAALAAATVAVALSAAGRPRDDLGVVLAGDEVRDAALALAFAQRARRRASAVVVLVLVPSLFGALVAVLGLLPPEYAPLAHLVGVITARRHLRA